MFWCPIIGEPEMHKLKAYHTYNIASLGRMKFELMEDGSWGRKENAVFTGLDLPLEDEEEVDEEDKDEKGEKEFTSLAGPFGVEESGQQKSIPKIEALAKKSSDESISIHSLCV